MDRINRGELPVLAFALCVVVGLALLALTGEWIWAASALLAGIIAGDIVEAIVKRVAPRQ